MAENRIKTISETIASAAYQRLKLKFSEKQARLLAQFMVWQAQHETGNFTSGHFKNSNNAFGYSRYSKSPYQIGAGAIADNKQPVGKYASVEDSAREVADWIGRRKASFEGVTNTDQYAAALKTKGYYGDTLQNYARGLAAFAKNYPAVTIAASGVSAFLILGILIFITIKISNNA